METSFAKKNGTPLLECVCAMSWRNKTLISLCIRYL